MTYGFSSFIINYHKVYHHILLAPTFRITQGLGGHKDFGNTISQKIF